MIIVFLITKADKMQIKKHWLNFKPSIFPSIWISQLFSRHITLMMSSHLVSFWDWNVCTGSLYECQRKQGALKNNSELDFYFFPWA